MPDQYAIIHTTSRVIRRLTITSPPEHDPATETAVLMNPPIDLAGGWWKLNGGNNKVSATDAEADTAGINEAAARARRIQRRQALLDKLDEIIADGTAPARLRQLCQVWKELFVA